MSKANDAGFKAQKRALSSCQNMQSTMYIVEWNIFLFERFCLAQSEYDEIFQKKKFSIQAQRNKVNHIENNLNHSNLPFTIADNLYGGAFYTISFWK